MRRAAIVGVGGALALLLLAQLALPQLAEREVTKRLGGGDEVTAAKVEALPAIELLWRHADKVSAHVKSFDAREGSIADDLAETTAVDALDVRIDTVRATDDVELHDVRVSKRDGVLHGSAVLDPAQLGAVLPAGVEATLVADARGRVLVDARIAGASMRLRVDARDGRVVARPEGLLGAITSYTLFSDPRIDVQEIGARELPDGRYALTASARVR